MMASQANTVSVHVGCPKLVAFNGWVDPPALPLHHQPWIDFAWFTLHVGSLDTLIALIFDPLTIASAATWVNPIWSITQALVQLINQQQITAWTTDIVDAVSWFDTRSWWGCCLVFISVFLLYAHLVLFCKTSIVGNLWIRPFPCTSCRFVRVRDGSVTQASYFEYKLGPHLRSRVSLYSVVPWLRTQTQTRASRQLLKDVRFSDADANSEREKYHKSGFTRIAEISSLQESTSPDTRIADFECLGPRAPPTDNVWRALIDDDSLLDTKERYWEFAWVKTYPSILHAALYYLLISPLLRRCRKSDQYLPPMVIGWVGSTWAKSAPTPSKKDD